MVIHGGAYKKDCKSHDLKIPGALTTSLFKVLVQSSNLHCFKVKTFEVSKDYVFCCIFSHLSDGIN